MMAVRRWPYKTKPLNRGGSENDKVNELLREIAPAFRYGPFYTRAEFVERFDNGDGKFFPDVGSRASAGGVDYIYDGTSTEILDLPGWRPDGVYTPRHFGSAAGVYNRVGGDGIDADDIEGLLLSSRFETLVEAQAVFPKATSLSQTLDAHAIQRMIDARRDTEVVSSGINREISDDANRLIFDLQSDVYVINRTADFGSIRGSHTFWHLIGNGAVIVNQCVGQTGFDLLGSRKCYMHGWTMIGDLKLNAAGTALECPRSGILVGRASGGAASDCHKFGAVDFVGKYTLGGVHNYASEDFRLGNLAVKNDLDDRIAVGTFTSATGDTFTTGEEVTWTGSGAGTMLTGGGSGTTSGNVAIYVTAGTLSNSVVITGTTSGKVATLSNVFYMPSGEGPNGEAYCLVQDGENYWGTDSQYATNAAQNTAASFLRNIGVVDLRMQGKGSAMWICRAECHNYDGSYLVSQDSTYGAAVVLVANLSTQRFRQLSFDIHMETDEADSDPGTGLQYGFLFRSVSAGADLFVTDFRFKMNKSNPAIGQFATDANVDTVLMFNPDIECTFEGDTPGQVMFYEPSKFTLVGGRLSYFNSVSDTMFNIADLAGCTSEINCNNVYEATQLIASSHAFSDPTGAGFMHEMHLINTGVANSARVQGKDAAGDPLGHLEFAGATLRIAGTAGGEELFLSSTALYPSSNGGVNLGASTFRYGTAHATNLDYSSQIRYQGTKVLGAQQAHIPNVSGGSTVDTEGRATTDAILAALRSHGIIASS